MPRMSCSAGRDAGTFLPSRRGFLIAAMGTGVALGFTRSGLAAVEFPSAASGEAGAAPAELFEPTIWYSIDRSGLVTVNIIRAEMGQHVGTALARIVADELEADWDRVRIVHVDSDPKWGLMVTGGSWSVWQSFPVMSRAGAAGRIALVEEGAKLLGVGTDSCTARNGVVRAGSGSIAYGDIVARVQLKNAGKLSPIKVVTSSIVGKNAQLSFWTAFGRDVADGAVVAGSAGTVRRSHEVGQRDEGTATTLPRACCPTITADF